MQFQPFRVIIRKTEFELPMALFPITENQLYRFEKFIKAGDSDMVFKDTDNVLPIGKVFNCGDFSVLILPELGEFLIYYQYKHVNDKLDTILNYGMSAHNHKGEIFENPCNGFKWELAPINELDLIWQLLFTLKEQQ